MLSAFVKSIPRNRYLLPGFLACTYLFDKAVENCGISGYVGQRPIAVSVVLAGLEELQSRGYDSAGVATLHEGEVRLTKYASSSAEVSNSIHKVKEEALQRQSGSCMGIGHTRWATHGKNIDINAHPHTDHNERIYVVHNGSISNTSDILKFLANHNIKPKSDTDTELIACLVGLYIDEGHELKKAVEIVLSRLAGTWGLAIIDKDNPNSMVVARKGSSIHIGLGDKEYFIASEPSAFGAYTSRYYSLDENEILELGSENLELEEHKIKHLPEENFSTDLGDYLHWTQKEIEEQPQSVARAIDYGSCLTQDGAKLIGLEQYKEQFLNIENLLITGCGSSLHAAMFGSVIFKKLGLMNMVQAIDASELTLEDIPKRMPGVVAISQSGETHDVSHAVGMTKSANIPTLSVVNVVGSKIPQQTDHCLYMNSGKERGVASTKSFLNSCIVLTKIALWCSQHLKPEDVNLRKQISNDLAKLPAQIGSVIEYTREQCKALANELKDATNMFMLGKGAAESIAKEGALKVKEITYIHAEGFASGALKHGPVALVEEGTPIIMILLNDHNQSLMNEAFEQLSARGAKVIVVTPDPDLLTSKKKPHSIIQIEEAGTMTPLLAVIPMQMLACYLSILRGLNPDTPRNMAKVVSVPG